MALYTTNKETIGGGGGGGGGGVLMNLRFLITPWYKTLINRSILVQSLPVSYQLKILIVLTYIQN